MGQLNSKETVLLWMVVGKTCHGEDRPGYTFLGNTYKIQRFQDYVLLTFTPKSLDWEVQIMR